MRGSKAGAGQTDLLPTVKNVVLVAAGKGGVGKSTVAANLAVALKMHGAATGLLDADIYGPSVPIIMGVKGEPKQIDVDGSRKIEPTMAHGLPVMSIGFFLDPDQAVIWRGPMFGKALASIDGGRALGRIGLSRRRYAAGHRRCANHFFAAAQSERRLVGRDAAGSGARGRGAGQIDVR